MLWCLQGRLCFIQPSNQPKKCCRSNMNPSKMPQTGSWSGEQGAASEVPSWVCVCVCVYLICLFSQIYCSGLLDMSEDRKREKEHTVQLLTHRPGLGAFLWPGRRCRSSGSLFTCCGEKAEGTEVNDCVCPGEALNSADRCRWSHLRLPATRPSAPADAGRRKWATKVG